MMLSFFLFFYQECNYSFATSSSIEIFDNYWRILIRIVIKLIGIISQEVSSYDITLYSNYILKSHHDLGSSIVWLGDQLVLQPTTTNMLLYILVHNDTGAFCAQPILCCQFIDVTIHICYPLKLHYSIFKESYNLLYYFT